MAVFTDVYEEDIEKLLASGYTAHPIKTIYEVCRFKKDSVNLVFYKSGKLLIQGKDDVTDKIVKEIKKLKIGRYQEPIKFLKEEGWIIGSDESLKGDTFGGITVAAVKADDHIRKKLLEIGVADSKKLADSEIKVLAEKIKNIAPCKIISMLPEEYNIHDGITDLLNALHKECAKELYPGVHIVDRYPGCLVGNIQTEKAESKYLEVAAASILARDAGLKQFVYLEEKLGFRPPMGSTHVTEGMLKLKEKNLPPEKFLKMHFANVAKIFGKNL